MARNVNEIEADEDGQQGGGMPDRDEFMDVLGIISGMKGKVSKLSGDISAKLTKAESDRNLDKKAFALVHWATRQEPARLGTFLRHFDAYREYADLDATAGSDLFEGATKRPEKAASERKGPGRPKKPKAAKPPKAAKKAKGTGKPRGRPPKAKEAEAEPVSAAEAAAELWGLNKETETAGAA